MKDYNIYIKNMVCPRCITSVTSILESNQIKYHTVQLGKVKIAETPTDEQFKCFEMDLMNNGFELLLDKNSKLVDEIKSIIIEHIHYSESNIEDKNMSVLLSQKLHYDYNYLSSIFSASEKMSIEKFRILQKIERVKELLSYNEMTLSEIANTMNYSSVHHLSRQFKRITGVTASVYSKKNPDDRNALDNIS